MFLAENTNNDLSLFPGHFMKKVPTCLHFLNAITPEFIHHRRRNLKREHTLNDDARGRKSTDVAALIACFTGFLGFHIDGF